MELLNIARENAAKILGVEAVKLPASVRCFEEQMEKTIAPDTEKRVRVDPVPVNKPSQVSYTHAYSSLSSGVSDTWQYLSLSL